MVQRRSFIAGIVGTAVAIGARHRPGFAYTTAVIPGVRDYSILIGGRESGRHSVQVEAEGEHCIATTRSSAELRMLVVPVFRYEHVCREIWHERRLVGFESRTEENGRSCWAAGRSTPSGFAVNGAGTFVVLPADVAPATYWNHEILERRHLLDPEDGTLCRQQVGNRRKTRLDWAPSIMVSEVDVTSITSGVVWYSPSGLFLGCRFSKNGYEIEFRARFL